MAKKILIALILLAFTPILYAYNVKAHIIDATDTEPVVGALCNIVNASDTTRVVAKSISDDNGIIDQRLDKAGSYILKISYVGLENKSVEFVINKDNPNADLGTVSMNPGGEKLAELVVTGRKPVIQANGEKVVYNLDEDPQTQTSSILEMLRKVPLVTVDGQDNIKVNGQSNFKITINGKENPMFSSNASVILKAMPASSIKKIEVITEPGAKYDAEGSGGILNIVTTDGSQQVEGYMAKVQVTAGNESAGGSIYGRGLIGKVVASLNYNFNDRYDNRPTDVTVDREIYGTIEAPSTHILMEGAQRQKMKFHQGAFDLSWEPDSLNLFTTTVNLLYLVGNNPISFRQSMRQSGIEHWSYHQDQLSKWTYGNVSANVGYQHTFGADGHNLSLSYQYNHGDQSTKSTTTLRDFENYYSKYPYQRYDVDNPTNEHTIQVDYTNPLSQKHKIETGAKAIFRRNSSDGVTYQGENPETLLPVEGAAVSMSQYQDVAAVYASYTGTYGKFGAKAGVRYEHTHMGVDFKNNVMPDFSSNLNDIVPNAALSYNLSPMTSLRMSYQMRITRPGVDQLNPYRDVTNPIWVSYGNPNLTSEKNNAFTLTFSNFRQKIGMNISAGYTVTDNNINQYSYVEDNVQYNTYANLGTHKGMFINAYMNFNLFKKVQWSINGGTHYDNYHFDEMGLKSCGWSYHMFANVNYDMPADIRLNVVMGFSQQGPQLQSDGTSMFKFYGLSLSRSFLKEKRLEVSLNAAMMFKPFRVHMNSWTSDSRTEMHIKSNAQRISVSIGYRIGSLSSNVKKLKSQIVNDDVQQSSGGGGAIGGTNATGAGGM